MVQSHTESHESYVFVKHIFVKKFWRTSVFREIFKNISTFYPC